MEEVLQYNVSRSSFGKYTKCYGNPRVNFNHRCKVQQTTGFNL
jgi:hypothetical protein